MVRIGHNLYTKTAKPSVMNKYKIEVTIIPNLLSPEMLAELWVLYAAYYPRSKASFLAHHKKFNYIALYAQKGQILGFTGLKINTAEWEGKTIQDIYVGQTIVDRSFRNNLLRLTVTKLLLEELRLTLSSDAHIWCSEIRYEPFVLSIEDRTTFYAPPRTSKRLRLNGLVDYLTQTNYGDSYNPIAFTPLALSA